MIIADLHADHDEAAALLLCAGLPEGWPGVDDARTELADLRADSAILRAAVSPAGVLLGWAGGVDAGYDGRVCELHPLVVRADARGRGIGRALVADIEVQAKARGALTLSVWTDDITGATHLGGIDLYPQPAQRLSGGTASAPHPATFYQRCGFALAGILPDANGPGKPDILLVKRIF